jgi:hypothetical protein
MREPKSAPHLLPIELLCRDQNQPINQLLPRPTDRTHNKLVPRACHPAHGLQRLGCRLPYQHKRSDGQLGSKGRGGESITSRSCMFRHVTSHDLP